MARILIVGASARAAAQSAANSGHEVIAADLFADRDTRAAAATCLQVDRYPDDFIAIRREFASLPVVYTGAIENYPDLVESLAAHGPLLGNGADSLQRLRDPFQLQRLFHQHGLPFPATSRSWADAQAHQRDGQWLIKSFRSAGGQQVRRLANVREGDDVVLEKGHYLQQCIAGDVVSAAFVSDGQACHLLGVSDMLVGCNWLGTDGFHYCGSISRSGDHAQLVQWQQIGQTVASEFQLVGVFGIDAVDREGTICPIEINPRYTASMEVHELSQRIPVMDLHIRACQGASLDLSSTQHHVRQPPVAGKGILFATRPVQIPNDLPRAPNGVMMADLPCAGQVIPTGYPILSLLYLAESQASVMAQLGTAANFIADQMPVSDDG